MPPPTLQCFDSELSGPGIQSLHLGGTLDTWEREQIGEVVAQRGREREGGREEGREGEGDIEKEVGQMLICDSSASQASLTRASATVSPSRKSEVSEEEVGVREEEGKLDHHHLLVAA